MSKGEEDGGAPAVWQQVEQMRVAGSRFEQRGMQMRVFKSAKGLGEEGKMLSC